MVTHSYDQAEHVITLDTPRDWSEFTAVNADWLLDEFGSDAAALEIAGHGGLLVGGGAFALSRIIVTFMPVQTRT